MRTPIALSDKRKTIRFIPGLWVEVYWHIGLSCWAAEAYSVEYDERGNSSSLYLGASYGLLEEPIVKPGSRRMAVRKLRMAIAERMNPKVKNVNKRIKPSAIPSIDYATLEMRFAVESLGVKLADHFIIKDVPT